jgi:hypothetical protein
MILYSRHLCEAAISVVVPDLSRTRTSAPHCTQNGNVGEPQSGPGRIAEYSKLSHDPLTGLTSFLESEISQTHIRLLLPLPAVRVRFPARFFCQGRPLRSRERKLRGLDSACGKAPGTATKGICFFFSSGNHARKKEERRNQMQERQHATWGRMPRL